MKQHRMQMEKHWGRQRLTEQTDKDFMDNKDYKHRHANNEMRNR